MSESNWSEKPATKGDVYYLGFCLLAAILAGVGLLYIEVDVLFSTVVMFLATVALSLGFSVGSKGYNRAFWSKVIDYE